MGKSGAKAERKEEDGSRSLLNVDPLRRFHAAHSVGEVMLGGVNRGPGAQTPRSACATPAREAAGAPAA